MNKTITPRLIFVISVVVVAAFSRLLPHLPNVTPVAAIALFAGSFINRKYLAFLLPLAALLLSDLFLGFYTEMYAIYISFAITVSIGMVLSKKTTAVNTAIASIASSLIFFILTNFAVWMSGNFAYPSTLAGLALCYELALPFFRNELFGTLAYNTLFFGALYLAKIKFPVLAKA
ncbi:MAG: DUF6580 family putative transport protein [Bacteroidota bacterium]